MGGDDDRDDKIGMGVGIALGATWLALLIAGWVMYSKIPAGYVPAGGNSGRGTALGLAIGGVFVPLLNIGPIIIGSQAARAQRFGQARQQRFY